METRASRLGWLYCIDVETGQTVWKQETSNDCNRDVNATGTIVAGLVITGTNAGLALAYSVGDGRPVWQCKLDGPCGNHLFLAGKQVVAAAESLYFLEPVTGELQGRVHWPGLAVAFAAGTPSQVVLFRRQSWEEFEKDNQHERNPESETVLVFDGTRLIREIRCSGYASAARYSHSTGLLYASGLKGIDILNPKTGEWLDALRPAKGRPGGCGLPDVAGNRIYAVSADGVVCALQHPNHT
jgi:hypothetical protein